MQVPLLYGWPNNQLLHVHNVDMFHQQYLVQPAAEQRARPLSPIRDQSRLKEAYARTESVFDRLRRSVPTKPPACAPICGYLHVYTLGATGR